MRELCYLAKLAARNVVVSLQFIFVAAAKYCVDIATHQHGCCVIQRCIAHATREYRENLVAEISANGLLLAQDVFG
ncbi:PREDICTED: putative pumilio homolog 7, chloroplastic isoform X2 [Ipomoea nil]|uniref:putative pumilio homolog 7, chloroplastic isoform X2 n=1 Tax=Ipomoea nil TaxID=35883 RepID=UPI000901B53B|nr:PREDICTED: putative pumilio homolog 7, chloroplastic isoform X2 [Ipomoea nil]